MLLLFPEVAESVEVAPLGLSGAAFRAGPGQGCGARHLAQGVGLLARGGLVAPLPPSWPRPGIIRGKYLGSELYNMNLEQ